MSRDCRACNGTGKVTCPRCAGTGKLSGDDCYYCEYLPLYGGHVVDCGACGGTGKIED